MSAAASAGPVLIVRDLNVHYGETHAVRHLALEVRRGERVAVVGESGSGKTSLGNAVAGFLDPDAATSDAAMIELDGVALDRSEAGPRIPRRTAGLSMIFQDAMSSLDPVWSVGSQLVAVMRAARHLSKRQAGEEALDRLRAVGIAEPDRVMSARPDALSGGMRQRVMMAIALASKPALLIADEPTGALDASLAVGAMRLMVEMAEREGAALLVISHDIELCRRYTDVVVVMYRGEIVERIASGDLASARHPYTRGLLECVPTLESAALDRLPTLESVRARLESDAA